MANVNVYNLTFSDAFNRMATFAAPPPGESQADGLARRGLYRNAISCVLASYKYTNAGVRDEYAATIEAQGSLTGLESILLSLCMNSDQHYEVLQAKREQFASGGFALCDSGAVLYNEAGDQLIGFLPSQLKDLQTGGKFSGALESPTRQGFQQNLWSSEYLISKPFGGHAVASHVNPSDAQRALATGGSWVKGLSFVGGVIVSAGLSVDLYGIATGPGAPVIEIVGTSLILGGVVVETIASGIDWANSLGTSASYEIPDPTDPSDLDFIPGIGTDGAGGFFEPLDDDGFEEAD